MAEIFKESDYAKVQIGKWHIGFTPETMPLAQGCNQGFGHVGGCVALRGAKSVADEDG